MIELHVPKLYDLLMTIESSALACPDNIVVPVQAALQINVVMMSYGNLCT